MGRRSSLRSSSRKRGLQVGSKVEARYDEDGFSDGWFDATITRVLYKPRRYSVSFDNIFADDAPEEPLTESVLCSSVRPRPPPEPTGAVFGIHQCVEAFHNEGWWPGVVCKFLDGGRGNSRLYSVYFPAMREEFDFKASDLRRPLYRFHGKWVSLEDAQAQEGAHLMFGERTRVEVSRDKEHFGAAWFVGIVLKVIGSRYFLVEYEHIRVDSDGGADFLLKEIVDLQYIRPCPPASTLTSFDILDEVEGFEQNDWFAGVVSVILPGSRYIVKYKHKEDDMLLDHTSLRPVHVWDDDHWVDIYQDCNVKTPAAGGTKSDTHKRKSSSGTLSASAAGNDDHVSDGSNFSSVKRKKEDGPKKKSMIKPSTVSKKSKKRSLSGILSDPTPSYKENDSEATDGSDVETFKNNEATGPGVKGGLELCESSKNLKAGNLLEETVSISKRHKLHASEQSSLSSAALTSHNNDSEVHDILLTSHNNDSEVHDILGVTNLTDRNVEEPSFQDKPSQSRKKLEKGKTLKENLQLVDGTPMDYCSKTPAKVGEGCPAAMPVLERSPALVSEELQSRSPSHESYAQKSKVGSNSQAIHLSVELCHGQEASKVTGTSEPVITCKESYSRLDEVPERQAKEANLVHLPVGHEAVDIVPIADWVNGKGNSSPTKTPTTRRKKQTVRPPRRQGNTPDVDDVKHHTHEVGEEHRGCITSGMKITFMARNSPSNDETLSHKQSCIMVDACVTPLESSIVNAESIKYSAVQQSSTMRSLPTGGEDIWSCASRVVVNDAEVHPESLPLTDRAHNHDELILSGSKSHMVAEMENDAIAPMPSGSLSSKENNVCGQQEISPCMLLYDGPVGEKKDSLNNTTPCGSPLSNEDTHAHDERIPTVFPSGISSSFVRMGEIQNSIMEPCENGRKSESQALLAGLQENIAPESNHLSPARPQSDGVVFKSSEATLADLLPMELSSEKSVLPFTKTSEFWELVESREVFRLFPQQPHFHPLHQYDQELREGMAVGLMVTFASLVSGISSMRIVDSQQDFELKIKVLHHLETHGFNVWSMRVRLERLLELRSRLILVEGEKQSLGAKLTVSEEQQKQNCLLTFSVEHHVSKLKQELAQLKKERASMLHEHHMIQSKIVDLKTCLQEAEDTSTYIKQVFISVKTAPW